MHHLTSLLCIALLGSGTVVGQYMFGRSFYSSVDEPVSSEYSSVDEKLQRLEAKLSAHFKSQLSSLRDRIETLERNLQDLRKVNTLDWNTTDSGSMYKTFAMNKSWDEAQSMCKSYGGRLAVVDNERKNAYITELINRQFPYDQNVSPEENKLELWIGLKTKAEMTSSSSRYSNFYDDDKVEGCAVMDRQGKWKIHPCRLPLGFVCQIVNVR